MPVFDFATNQTVFVTRTDGGNPDPTTTHGKRVVEAKRIRLQADAEIDAAATRAKEELRRQVGALAVAGAERLIRKEIDGNAHKALLDELAADI